MSGRGRGGKFNKAKRGGGKHFSRDLQPLDKEGNPLGMWRDPKDKIVEESSDEESSEESSEDEGPSTSSAAAGQELTREQRKEQARLKKQAAIAKKNKKVAEVGDLPTDSEEEFEDESEDDDMPANPNHTAKARKQASALKNLSRREREAIQQQQAKERYQKLHAEGKTDEARADLARLKLIKEQREQAAARKAAEQEEKDAQAAENKERIEREARKREAAMGGAAAGKKVGKGKK
ncbi:28 kDa heat- and acid-stable phosphoprotein [Cyphellophora attinorum]|uniref:28 kDa heat-and acid-stable phosphoprotein n=1 Tax=Cyphellophora attinorum TaxID=1664694 RepID=A0A0N0NR70_9EURO|nr:28 kDa heat- and acid-stable phosphoprotein [Phialophora attinorum]KPI44489.1 28 kDa heat- and acid-stable phosphoprotein [Phialophora attinorum]